jgi:hypothetical protein
VIAPESSWAALMRTGAFHEAWALSDRSLVFDSATEWRRPRHLQRIWHGAPIDGARVLVRCYHGLGDTLQFIRYAPLVKQRASDVTVWAQPALLSLISTVAGVDRVLPLHDGAAPCAYDVDVEVMELPHLFRSTVATLPRDVPYVHATATADGQTPRHGPRIGLAWRAGDWDRRRNVPLPLFAEAFGARLLARCEPLHADLTTDEARYFPRWRGGLSVAKLAGQIAGLDLVISVDTMAAHLAGALGRPTWLLLHADPDWRWMGRGRHSVWYPSLTLHRQSQPGAWRPVIQSVLDDLDRVLRDSTPSASRLQGDPA